MFAVFRYNCPCPSTRVDYTFELKFTSRVQYRKLNEKKTLITVTMNKRAKTVTRRNEMNKNNKNPTSRKRKITEENEVKQETQALESEEENSFSESEEIVAEDSPEESVANSDEENIESSNEEGETDASDNESNEIMADEEEEEEEEEGETQVPEAKKRKTKYNPAEEARLEKLIFGDARDVKKNLLVYDESAKESDAKKIEKSTLPMDDSDEDDLEFALKSDSEDDYSGDDGRKTVAWIDESDTNYSVEAALHAQRRRLPKGRPEKTYTELLEKKFTQMVGTPKWASLDPRERNDDEDDDSDKEISKRSNHLAMTKIKKLRKGTIDIKVLTDINKSTHSEGPIVTSVQFHPTSTVAIVAGLSGILSLFQIDGKENTKLQSIRFERFRINCAKFLHEGNQVILGSRNCAYSQTYDLMSGKTYKIPLPHGVMNMQKFEVSPDGKFIAVIGKRGVVHLLSTATKELVANFKMNRRCLAVAFCPNSEKLITHGDGEEMYIWDLKSRSCVHKAADDGCIASSAVTFSPSGQFIATGSNQGVVNIYDTETVMQQRFPQPLKVVLNLVTPISKLKFNPTSEILAMASKSKENAFKMLHIPSFSVFSNFPTFQTKIYHPLDIDFSPSSGYAGLTNDKGYAYLYRLKHYENY